MGFQCIPQRAVSLISAWLSAACAADITSKKLQRTEILNIREFVKMARQTPDDSRNKCIRLRNSNVGYFFTEANDNENKVGVGTAMFVLVVVGSHCSRL